MSTPATVVGTVKRITYSNEETGYFVVAISLGDGSEKVVTGTAPSINIGEQLRARGMWVDTSYGRQFKAMDVLLMPPTHIEGLEKYLSTAIKGIGPKNGKLLVANFGSDVFDIIEHEPERLGKVKGIGPKRAAAIVEAVMEQKAVRDVMLFLTRCGFGRGMAKKVIDKFGASSVAIRAIKDNPYILADMVKGIGFLRADEAAKKQGIPETSEYRLRAGLRYILRKAEEDGSAGLPESVALAQAGELLKVDEELIQAAINAEIKSGEIVRDIDGFGVDCLFSGRMYMVEKELAARICVHASRPLSRPITNVDYAVLVAELEASGNALTDEQRAAVKEGLSNQVAVITGGPGVGKTTVTRTLLYALESNGFEALLAAPTGKAAQRAAESTGHAAGTIHRVLDFKKGGFTFNRGNPLPSGALVLDEMSMAGTSLALHALRALPEDGRLVLIGDAFQLSSVDAGKVLADLVDADMKGLVSITRLTKIWRQAATSRIIVNAHAINRGEMPDLEPQVGSDFLFFPYDNKPKATDEEKAELTQRIQDDLIRNAQNLWKRGFDPVKDLQVLAPMRKGLLGTEQLNIRLQQALNPNPPAKMEVRGAIWGVGDKVIQGKNNYQKNVWNGDIGFIQAVNPEAGTVAVQMPSGLVTYNQADLSQLSLAWAITIHKSQGSEAPVIIMPIHTSHYKMLKRNLLYTGVTRAKKLCMLFGSKWAVKMAVDTPQNDDRHTRLKVWLKHFANSPIEAEKFVAEIDEKLLA